MSTSRLPRLPRARAIFRLLLNSISLLPLSSFCATTALGAATPPNIVLIFCDDLAYSDLGCYGNQTAKTPNLDRMAREGMRFTDFYVGQPVCSASRAALMTGCYPNRVGIQGALSPKSKTALNTNEITIAELLKTRGYATAIYGKWHLGHTADYLPSRQGFDDYFGLPYSNDMWPNHPISGTNFPPLPLFEGDRIIDGKDIWPLLSGQRGAKSPHEAFFYYWEERLESVRSGKWKLHLGHECTHPDPPGAAGKPGKIVNHLIGVELFDLENDISEKKDLAKKFPAVVQRLQALAEQCRDDMGDSAQKRTGKNVRPPGLLAMELADGSSPNANPNARTVQQAADGTVLLHARNAFIHGSTVRYEPQTNKNTIGYWTKLQDWVSWDFSINQPGTFEVEILQGCGKGSGGSEVEFSIGEQILKTVVQDTGGFQTFLSRNIGKFKFDHAGRYNLFVKPVSKPGLAVMDLRSVTFKPNP